jgi:osmotically inducible protein OsmC
MMTTGYSTWKGSWKEGGGTISTQSETIKNQSYSFSSRFEGAPGARPEELLAAAHAGCFNQALANNFGMIEHEATSIRTSVMIELIFDEKGRPTITNSYIATEAQVPGISEEQFLNCAERARSNCSISKILKCEISLSAKLLN